MRAITPLEPLASAERRVALPVGVGLNDLFGEMLGPQVWILFENETV